MYRLLFPLSLLLFSFTLQAQTNFVSGYIVRNGNDTVRGQVNDLQWKQGPYILEFRPSGGEAKSYSPGEIRGFGYGNHHYRSERVFIRTSAVTPTAKLTYKSTPDQAYAQVFLKELVRGKISLFVHSSASDDSHFFLQQDADSLTELILHRYLIQSGGGYLSTEVNRYRQQLGYYFSDCPDVQKKLATLPYTEKAITGIFNEYNLCMDPAFRPQSNPKKKRQVALSVFGGYASTAIRLRTDLPEWEGASPDVSADGFGGVGLELGSSREFSHTFLFTEVTYRSFSNGGSHTTVYNPSFRDEFDYQFDMRYLAFQVGARHEFTKGMLRPFICGGGSLAVGLDQSGSITRTTLVNNNVTAIETNDPLIDYRRLDLGVLVGAGMRYGRLHVQVNYIYSNGFSEYNRFTATLSRVEGRVGVRIL